jgi:hypothetical protein
MERQNFKYYLAMLPLFIFAGTAVAFISQSFSSWGNLTKNSPDIIIARCRETPETMKPNGHMVDTQGWIISNMEVVSVLKGATNSGNVKLGSEYCPRQGELYLIFSNYHDGYYTSTESYRFVPLGLQFSTNMIEGVTLDERIQNLLERRLNSLNQQMKSEQEEKQRLEDGLKN